MATKDLYTRAAALCSRSEHCSAQVREKLLLWGATAEEAERIIARLADERFVSDSRFARAYCHDKFCYSHWGRVKIRQMLRHLRLDGGVIEEGLAAIPEEDYLAALSDALRQKDRTLRDADIRQRKAKLVRHLLSRGFETGLVMDAVAAHLGQD